jgi:hypothetical protein
MERPTTYLGTLVKLINFEELVEDIEIREPSIAHQMMKNQN